MSRRINAIAAWAMCFVAAVVQSASADTASGVRHRVLLSNCNSATAPSQSQIMCFDIYPDSLQYVRTIVHPLDGHCRVPISAVAVDGVVYVSDWSGKDDSDTADPSFARILKYDLEGNYLGVFRDEILSPEGEKVCRLGKITASNDGKYLYVYQPAVGKSGLKPRFYRYRTADATGGAILENYEFTAPSDICGTDDGKTLFVTDKAGDESGNVSVFTVKENGGFDLVRKYYAQDARGAYLDEQTGRLYVSGKQISVFDYNSESSGTIAAHTSESDYSQVAKIGGEFYAVRHDRGTVRKVSYDPNDETVLSCTDLEPGYQTTIKRSNLTEVYNLGCVFALSECGIETCVREVARYEFEDDVCSPIYTNSIARTFPIRAVRTQSGAVGVNGKALYFAESYANAVIEGSGGMIGGDYGIFMWFGGKGFTKTSRCLLLSNSMRDQNKGYLSLLVEAGKFTLKSSFISGKVSNGVLQSGEVKLQHSNAELFLDKKYHHLGVVKKKDTISIWVDGKKVADRSGVRLGIDDTMDFVLGGSADASGNIVLANSYMDDLRFFNGAPSDEQVEAMYDEYKDVVGSLGEPVRPSYGYKYDSSVAETCGNVIAHAYAHQPMYDPPSITVGANGEWWISYGFQAVPSSRISYREMRYSSDRGETWIKDDRRDSAKAYRGFFFECPEDGQMYLFGRVSIDWGTAGYSIWYNNPTNGCEGRVGFVSHALQESAGYALFTNDAHRSVLRFPTKKAEPDLVTDQEIYPGGGFVAGGRLYLAYLAADKIGMLSGKVTPDVGIYDFKAQAAQIVSSAAKPFPGPVFAAPDGRIATFIPAGTDALGTAAVHLAVCGGDDGRLAISKEGISLPGADRPFAVKYDPVLGHYWAMTTPEGKSLCLYVSQDLEKWEPAQTVFAVSDPETMQVMNPSFDFSGRDLAVAFNLACPDGSEKLRAKNEANHIVARRVWSFRRYSPWKKGAVMIVR